MNSNKLISKNNSKPILEWILKSKNRKKYITEEPEHGGHVVARDHLHSEPKELVEGKFPFKELFNIADEIKDIYNLPDDTPIEPNYGFLICYSTSGHRVHEHMDANFNADGPDSEDLPHDFLGDVIHVRFNVLISKPEVGGNPVIENKEYKVKENEVWRCMAGIHEHYTTTTLGEKPRVLLSFGYFINVDDEKEKGWY